MLQLLFIISVLFCINLSFSLIVDVSDPKQVELVGRFDTSNPSSITAEWPSSLVRFYLQTTDKSTNVAINFNLLNPEYGNYVVDVFVNDIENEFFLLSESDRSKTISLQITGENKYKVEFFKRTESAYSVAKGMMQLGSLDVSNAVIVPINEASSTDKLKFLFIGDSITSAYGVDGVAPCTFSIQTENVLDGYASLTARAFSADFHTISWSGKGAVRNYGDSQQTSVDPLPYYYNRTIATNANSNKYWNPNNWVPDIIYVMLGSNDYSTSPVPSDDQFITGFSNFIKLIQKDYPKSTIIIGSAPHSNGNQAPNIATVAQMNNVDYVYMNPNVYDIGGYGCDSHPSKQTQVLISNYVITAFQKNLAKLLLSK